ncbi:hypothetical protein LXA54_17155 [Erwinia amylovora]|uniref:hypothetical protein n=1 Tax=Erwinia amylovora TaxID=552 RepID=UPI0020BEBF85|nr:hypothetical protein [Erwinia amylovora]MCK8336019.1 hypothetical protein [Erwinia amylovora]
MLHHYDDIKGGESYKSVAVRLSLDGKLNHMLSRFSEGFNVGKKNIIEALFNITISNDEFFLSFDPHYHWKPQDVYEGYCPVGVSIQLDAYLNFKITTLSRKVGINKKTLLILVLNQFIENVPVLEMLKERLALKVK